MNTLDLGKLTTRLRPLTPQEAHTANVAACRARLDATREEWEAEHGAARAEIEQAALNRLMDGTAAARSAAMLRDIAGRMRDEARGRMTGKGDG